MTDTVWTVSRVRAELPLVQVQVGDKTFTGTIKGRSNDSATVVIDCGCVWCKNGHHHKIEYAWSTVTRSMQETKPLRA